MRGLFLYLLAAGFLLGCETESSVENPASTHFIKFYGKDGDQTGRDLVVLPDGSMVLFGTSRATVPTRGSEWYVVKVDAKGTIIWEQEYGGPLDDEARDIEVTSLGDLVLVGNTYKDAVNRDIRVMRLSAATGLSLDSAVFSVRDSLNAQTTATDEDASMITELPDGFLISGSTNYLRKKFDPVIPGLADARDALKIRLNTDLSQYPNTWLQTQGYRATDVSVKVIPAPTGGYGNFYSFGYSNRTLPGSTPNYNYWVLALGPNGDPLNTETYLGTPADEKMSGFVMSGAGFFVSGLVQSGPADFLLAELGLPDEFLGYPVLLQKNLSYNLGTNLSGHTATCRSIVNGGFLVLGEENGFNSNQNWALTRINANGTLAWSRPIVYGGEGFDSAGAVQELPDGRVVIIGTMRTGRPDAGEYKLTLVKVSAEGKFE
jgi:hypothetical protein